MSKLDAQAKPFSFNPNAKAFVFQEAPPVPVPPPVVLPTRLTYTRAEMFALQQPMYSGSTLIFPPNAHLGAFLNYDPTFDYLSAGLIRAVPREQVEQEVAAVQDGSGGGADGLHYDMVMSPNTGFAPIAGEPMSKISPKKAKLSPKKRRTPSVSQHVSPQKTTSGSKNASPLKPEQTGDNVLSDTLGNTTAAGSDFIKVEVIDGVCQDVVEGESPVHSEMDDDDEGEDDETDEEDEEDDEEYDDDEDDEHGVATEGETADAAYDLQQGQQYMWANQQPYKASHSEGSIAPGVGGATVDDMDVSYQNSQKYYYFNTAESYAPSMFEQGDTSLHADRRRQKQSAYFSHFTQPSYSSNYSSYPSHYSSGRNNYSSNTRSRTSGSYSPPLMAQRRDLYFQQDLHLHLSEKYLQRPQSLLDAERKSYSLEEMMAMGRKEKCKEKPSNLPHYLSDIYKTDSPPRLGRSLFGGIASSSNSSSAAGRGIFGSLTVQENTNHTLSGISPSSSLTAPPSSLPPKTSRAATALALATGAKTPGKGSKRKKNKERSERALEDEERVLLGGTVGEGAAKKSSRNRALSVDPDDTENERKEDSSALPPVGMRGLHTPKMKSVKGGRKGDKKSAAGSKKLGGKSRHGAREQEDSTGGEEFADATMADLHHTENAWTRSTATAKAQQDSLLLIAKAVRAILNKLSIDTLPVLVASLLDLPLTSPSSLQVVVDAIFEKSVDEPPFAQLYALFCARLAPHLPTFREGAGENDGPEGDGSGLVQRGSSSPIPVRSGRAAAIAEPVAGSDSPLPGSSSPTLRGSSSPLPVKMISFRTLLLTRCYTLLVEDEESLVRSLISQQKPFGPPLTELVLAEKRQLLKLRQLGNLSFIGELFKQSLLRSSVVHLCLDMLLDGGSGGGRGDGGDDEDEPSEWSVECVCTFLQTVGAKLDSSPDPDELGPTDDPEVVKSTRKSIVDAHFRQLFRLARHPSLPSRFRFMCLDLLDLRARRWVPRMQKQVDPQSLEQIREQAQAQAAQTPAKFDRHASYQTTIKKPQQGKQTVYGQYAAGARTAARPSGPSAIGGGLSSKPSPYQGRSLHFGDAASPSTTPMFQRSISAPDRNDLTSRAGGANAPAPFSPLVHAGMEAIAAGKYLPVWKRRELGLAEGAVLPRSTKTEGLTEGEASTPQLDTQSVQSDRETSAAPIGGNTPAILPSAADVEQPLSVLLDEMYSAMDVKEALQCYTELTAQYPGRALAQSLTFPTISKAVEQRSPAQRDLAGKFLAKLMQHEDPAIKLSQQEVLAGTQQWLEMLSDVAIDIPHAPAHTHTILASLLAEKLLTFEQILPLYANAVEMDIMMESDAAAWLIALLKQLRVQLVASTPEEDVDAHLVSLLQPTSSSSVESSIKFARFFGGDAARGAAALAAAGLEKVATVLG